MVTIRIPQDHWGEVWQALVAAGPISRLRGELVYLISDSQHRLLRRKKLPFELVESANGQATDEKHG